MKDDSLTYGAIAIIAGLVLIIVAFATYDLTRLFPLPFYCFGITLFIIGIIIAVVEGIRKLCRMPTGRHVIAQQAPFFCTECGTPLIWIYEYQRWFCCRCQKYP